MTGFRLVQLSDPHIGADWGVAGADPVRRLARAVDSVLRLGAPDAVVVSGDLVEHGADDEYATVRELLAAFGDVPLHVLPGNHDDRAALRRHFELAGDAEPIDYAVDLGPLRLVALDTTVPGEDFGELDGEQLAWLDEALAEQPERPTLIALHHPPLVTGVPAMDELSLRPAHRDALGEVLTRHPQVQRITAGHVHRPIVGELAGVPVQTLPSTYLQLRLDLDATQIELTDEPAAFAVHAVVDGGLVSHLQPVVA